ncbi:EcoKI restriction-modification system protein HsdS [Photobacterium damselae subsp. piscicida]|uniref:EcoKI restriction-modification system protein HsdS n=1 Tax=Photobacterium damsela subsp. piscicida TaxID=38294 RepID=A0A5F0YLV4_PHODP|nr:restriction endonuclease subunit S [Photobacterium damselae]MBE8129228.1 restriction endonuclease subunit S [Photobacterium damselae subsp. piscicida]PSV74161.1 restriction endonuclease [Photobacterium damselae]PSW77778.1 restriction endonuclease [Photobacterium damselae]QOD53885.1 restriction endonuclease subunit S [Photobacterium damselae subsp. piscicida]QOD57715.1 restriction endonuclease subunit S [Photobacterium damselae subsp. piscicida]
MAVESLITQHIDTWTSAVKTKSTSGRGSSKKLELYGVKKLRELILELAVRGKLVPQDPSDEPASVLFHLIKEEQTTLVKEKKIKKQKKLPKITEAELLFELPNGWTWCRVGDLFNTIQSGGTPSKREPAYWQGNIPWASVKDLGKSLVFTDTQDHISQEGLLAGSKLANEGDWLICTRMGLGKIGIVSTPMAFNQDLKAVSVTKYVHTDFFLNSYRTIKIKGTGTTVAGITQDQLLNYVFALPPEKEQHRIVAKVDELMALCDQLEQQTEANIEAHQLLVRTLLNTLTHSADADELMENWARISDHFETLFTTEESIDQLKQTILQLAVMGKLVPQDPNDEPASVLLERIAEEKAQLIKEKKIKKQKALPPIADDEKPFDLPTGWEWTRFGYLVNFKAELVRPEEYLDLDQVAPDSIEKGTGKLIKRRTVAESGVKGPNSRFYAGQVLYSKIRPSLSKAIIAEFDGLCSADMYPLEAMVNSEFLLKIILSEVFLTQVRAAENRIKMPKLNVDSLSNILVPICPDNEMGRITSKLTELLFVSDQLKQNINKSHQTQLQLTDAIVEQAV